MLKIYSFDMKEYMYDSEINLIDQLYVVWYLLEGDENVVVLVDWIKQEFQINGKLYGRYLVDMKEFVVQYELLFVYVLVVLFLIKQYEDIFVIKVIYDRMNDFEIFDLVKMYYGGYMSGIQMYFFDNLLLLLVERKFFNEIIIQ